MTVGRSSGVTVSRSRVYFGFWSWNPLTCISIAVLSRLAVSGVSVRYLMTSPPPWPPPQPVVPRSTAPASPAPLSLRKSLRLTALVALGICSSILEALRSQEESGLVGDAQLRQQRELIPVGPLTYDLAIPHLSE